LQLDTSQIVHRFILCLLMIIALRLTFTTIKKRACYLLNSRVVAGRLRLATSVMKYE